MASPTRTSDYDQYAEEYAAVVATRERDDILEGDPFGILRPLLEQLGDVAGQDVLDAGCGEGYLSRILAALGAPCGGITGKSGVNPARSRHCERGRRFEYHSVGARSEAPRGR